MKILIYPQGCLPTHANMLDERALGGTETGIIRVAAGLRDLGHSVIVLTQLSDPPLSDPLYVPYSALGDVGPVDIIIAVREWSPLLLPIEARYRFFWTGDSYDQPQNLGLGDRRVASRIDGFFAVSEWHRDRLCEMSRFPKDRCCVIKNGVNLEHFSGSEVRARKRLIYSSTPYRGLQLIPIIYRALLQRHSNVELHIFSDYEVYAGAAPYSERVKRDFEILSQQLRTLPNCFLHGNVRQRELAREFMKSSILFYPNTFEETSCITALEAQAAGCAIVTSAIGALPETVGNAGLIVPGTPGTQEYLYSFIEATDKLLSDDRLWSTLSANGLTRAKELTWHHVAQRIMDYVGRLT